MTVKTIGDGWTFDNDLPIPEPGDKFKLWIDAQQRALINRYPVTFSVKVVDVVAYSDKYPGYKVVRVHLSFLSRRRWRRWTKKRCVYNLVHGRINRPYFFNLRIDEDWCLQVRFGNARAPVSV